MRNRLDQRTEQWQRCYAIRASIETTLSRNVPVHGLRRSRYRGLARTHTALACNITRVSDWVSGTPRTRRRTTRFPALCLCAATT
ncbi:transposase [Streptomyces sp. NPDC026665]|uniref:transposase n=1 Tax=Streptomyces sp. NPDC026665 TaxID=3154798 RepID=UPI0033FC6CCC